MAFYADLHIHSKYSRATSGDCDLEHLALWAGKKGISVVATGDFTHPGWFEEIREKLVPAEPGLFRLRPDLEEAVRRREGGPAGPPVRFMLEVEISTIYKRGRRTRKVHHLIYVPDLEKAQALRQRLAAVGNIHSDGRPILGLDSRHLLDMVLECGEGCYLIPAHIWTPWFAVLGSKSGFDDVEECYGDLAREIFALETGLSSDPPMNWRLSRLDRYRLVSNSDAHSPPKLGRECCVFDTQLDYFAMRRALQTGEGYRGTVEFYPEEGKYHYDGHRKCGVCLAPEETRRHGGRCPVCGKPVTLGVMHRVIELADRDASAVPAPTPERAFRSLIPLEEILGEIFAVGSGSKRVRNRYEELTARLGPELFVLDQAPLEQIRHAGSELLAEAIRRMRQGCVIRQAGYDGQYGTIRLFRPDEFQRGSPTGLLFDLSQPERVAAKAADQSLPYEVGGGRQVGQPADQAARSSSSAADAARGGVLDQLDPQQRAAAQVVRGPLLIVAGPGTGKTRTLTHRIAHLIADRGVPPERCLAITFTRRAAGEMRERLEQLLPGRAGKIAVMTFHALALSMLEEHGQRLGLAAPVRVAAREECLAALEAALGLSRSKASQLLVRISRHKRSGTPELETEGELAAARQAYDAELRRRGMVDFDDLVGLAVRLLEEHPDLAAAYRQRYQWVSVDEYQDVDPMQYRLIRLLVPPEGNLCVIGDPDQAIYGFRGSDVRFFQRFREDYPAAREVSLVRNYRSTKWIVDGALQLVAPATLVAGRSLETGRQTAERIEIHECPSERAEAELVVHRIEQMVGGSTFFSLDSGRAEGSEEGGWGFADFAVLYRTEAQAEPLVEALSRSGIPFQKRTHAALAERPGVRALVDGMAELPDDRPLPERLAAAAEVAVSADPELVPALPLLEALARKHAHHPSRFLAELALATDVDLWDPRADRVSLLTLHAAKGLEFPVVFITGCEDGLIPLHWGSPDQADLAEERRLLFVGMTRAQSRLVLTWARKRLLRGAVRRQQISPFLEDIHRQLLALHRHRVEKRRRRKSDQKTLFEL